MVTEHIVFDQDEIAFRMLNKEELKRVDKAFELLNNLVEDDCFDENTDGCWHCGGKHSIHTGITHNPRCPWDAADKFLKDLNAARSHSSEPFVSAIPDDRLPSTPEDLPR
jgi:hypothetical protein